MISAALGVAMPFLTRVSRSTAAQPATSGVAMLVPVSKKNGGSLRCRTRWMASHARERVDRMHGAGRHDVGLDPSLLGRTAAAEGDHSVGVVRHAVGEQRVCREVPGQYSP